MARRKTPRKDVKPEEKRMETKEFFEMLNVSDKLREEFFEDPERVANQYGVKFTDEQMEKIRHAAGFVQTLKELRVKKLYPDPDSVAYPLDIFVKRELMATIRHIIPPPTKAKIPLGKLKRGAPWNVPNVVECNWYFIYDDDGNLIAAGAC